MNKCCMKMNDYSWVRGFNYHPSYCAYGEQIWEKFDPDIIRKELANGIKLFPAFNTVRIWLSWNYWKRDKEGFIEKTKIYFRIIKELGLKIIPVLFNRWHDLTLEFGGIYIDNFLTEGACYDRSHLEFTREVVKAFADDDCILIWDICNEPFSYINDKWSPSPFYDELYYREMEWLKEIYAEAKKADKNHPVSVSPNAFRGTIDSEALEAISDVFLIHPYMWDDVNNENDKKAFEAKLDSYLELKKKYNKEILVTETCWGNVDDMKRSVLIDYTLFELKKRNFGWIAHALYESYAADLHSISIGPLGVPGDLSFIRMDGSLRQGHNVFNKY